MDWRSITLEPNLKFASELKDDLKVQYYERHERAKQSLANFSSSLQNVYLEHQKLIADNVELSIITEKLKQIIKEHESNQQLSNICNKPYSEVVSASTNCKLEVISKTSFVDDEVCNNDIFNQKENVCEYVPIYTEDFNSDIEETGNKSPVRPVVNSLDKVQNSPVLSKSKRHGTKKSNSSISNNSIASNNSIDSRVSITNTPNKNYRNAGEDNNEPDAEFERMSDREPLHGIENSPCTTPKKQNKSCNVLSVSKIDYGKTEFTGGGKKLRQSKLTLKKIVPLIDISKVDSDENFNKTVAKSQDNSTWSETCFNNECTSTRNNFRVKNNDFFYKKESKANKDLDVEKNIPNQSVYDDDLIETSPAQSEASKLRNKLNMKKPETNKFKSRHTTGNVETVTNKQNDADDKNQNDYKTNYKSFSKPTTSNHNKVKTEELSETLAGGKRKSFDCYKSLGDETYFTPAELTCKNRDMDFDIDATNFEDEVKNNSPPIKRMLMSSFDEIPGRKEKSPGYAYKEVVRKKAERAQLPGWSCKECEMWYDNLPYEEKMKRQNDCSKHRSKYKVHDATPESFWNPVFDDDGNDSLSNSSWKLKNT